MHSPIDGTFESGVSFGAGEMTYAAVTADLDGDGDQDIVVANVEERNAVYWNDGSGLGWVGQWLGDEAHATYGLAVGDLDGDGYPELGFANSDAMNRLFANVASREGRD